MARGVGELVRVVQRPRDITDDRDRDVRRTIADARRRVRLHQRPQRAAVDVLEDEVVVAVVHAGIEDRDEVRVAQARADRGFAAQRRGGLSIGAQVLERPLDHDVALEAVRAIDAREIDARRTARTDRLDELVRPDAITIACTLGIHVPRTSCSFEPRRMRAWIVLTISPTAAHDSVQRFAFARASRSSTMAAAVG